MVAVIKIIRTIILIVVALTGGCVYFLWQDYQQISPCISVGEQRGLENIRQYAQAGNNYPATCGGYRGSQYVAFRTR